MGRTGNFLCLLLSCVPGSHGRFSGRSWAERSAEVRARAILTRKYAFFNFENVAPSLPLRRPDLLEPHILRSLSNVKITSVHASCCACHFVALDVDGAAWMFGRNAPCALGVAGVDVVSEDTPRRVLATDLGAERGVRFVHAACGRSHTLLVDSQGNVWSAGANNLGQVRAHL